MRPRIRIHLTALTIGGLLLGQACDTTRTTDSDGNEPDVVGRVLVSPTNAALIVGETRQLSVTVESTEGEPLERAVTWSTSAPTIAAVSGTGMVTAKVSGNATITAKSELVTGTATITVSPPPAIPVGSVTVSPATGSTQSGTTLQLAVTVKDANNNVLTDRPVTWSSSHPARASVSGTGLVTGGANAGQATITATSEGQSGTAVITNTVPVAPVATVTVSPATASTNPGTTVQLTAILKDANGNQLTGRTVTWTASNPGRANVSSSGLVTGGNNVGNSTITATSEGQSGTAVVTNSIPVAPVATVTVAPPTASVGSGSTVQLTATLKDANGNELTGRPITWTSSANATASVSATGLVTGGSTTGQATITATSEGKSGTSAITVTSAPPPPPPPTGDSVVFVGAGDIADCSPEAEYTARLLDGIAGTVFTAGDNAYDSGTAAEYANCYEPTWGRHKARTRPSLGNHDYYSANAGPSFAYYGAGLDAARKGYFSYELGNWHIIVINSNVAVNVGSAQHTWLKADLAANTKKCTLAYWHHPRYSSGDHWDNDYMQPIWQALYDGNADVIVAGHDHNYERFHPMNGAGQRDDVRGMRSFVVGTGGRYLRETYAGQPQSVIRNHDTFGVIKFTLYAESYRWKFIPIAGQTFTDAGTGTCH